MEMSLTPSQFTGKDIAEYLAASFNDRELPEFLERIDDAVECNGLFITHDKGKITGVCIGIALEPNVFHGRWLKANGLNERRAMIRAFVVYHKGRIVTARRHGKFVVYNTTKLLKKFYRRA